MPADLPPKSVPQPHHLSLPAGSILWMVTKSSPANADEPAKSLFRQPPTEQEMQDGCWGERFDPTPDCPYPYCYAAFDDLTALGEVLLRDVSIGARQRYLLKAEVSDRHLMLVETRRPLWLISLRNAADLAQVRQDSWLVQSESRDFSKTQLWAHWLRDSTGPEGEGPPAGIAWPSRRQPNGLSVLFFGDRCADAVVRSPFGERRLDDAAGSKWLNLRLSQLYTRLGPSTSHPSRAASDA